MAKELATCENAMVTITFDIIMGGNSILFGDGVAVETSEGFLTDPKRKN